MTIKTALYSYTFGRSQTLELQDIFLFIVSTGVGQNTYLQFKHLQAFFTK